MNKTTIKAILAVVILVPGLLWQGFVLSCFWGWFAVPLGVPAIDLYAGAGLCFMVAWVAHADVTASKVGELLKLRIGEDEYKDFQFSRSIESLVVNPAIALLFGWIIASIGGAA